MAAIRDPAVLTCLVEHLTLGELCRLRRALGTDGDGVDAGLWHLRIPDRVTPFDGGLRDVCRYMNRRVPRRRCRECGRVTTRRVRVCTACTCVPGGYYQLVSRRDVRQRWPDLRPCRMQTLYATVPVACHTRLGAILYWMRDVNAVLARTATPSA